MPAAVAGDLGAGGGCRRGGGVANDDPPQPGRICPGQTRLARQALKLSGLEDDGGADTRPDQHVRSRTGPVEKVAEGDAAVAVDRIGLQRHGARNRGTGKHQGRYGPEDQEPHDFTCALTDSIWSAVVMTLEFIS